MKLVVQVKLVPDAAQASALSATLRTLNEAANRVSAVAFDLGVPRTSCASTPTPTCAPKVWAPRRPSTPSRRSATPTRRWRPISGPATSAHPVRSAAATPSPRRSPSGPRPPHPFDDRCLSWQYDQQRVSIWTTAGRLKNVGFACAPEALKTLIEHRQGESDLVERDGVFYLMATCEVPEAEQYEPDGFIGVDLGIANIATTSTGYRAAGRGLNRHRKRQAALRTKLQAKKTTSAKRRLKKRNRRERRDVANTNHVIAKQIVTEAERTSSGIALEDLTGIRQRVRLCRPQRVAIHSWAFARLAAFITYKAKRAGVPLVSVDPAYTSRECAECRYIDTRNRVDQARFVCRSCGVVAHADRNASRAIARRGEAAWNAGRESRVPAAP
ncbi:RNA-guided endonuclease InsQ/TnpB family protein [Streptomonospora litoralis]|uniref:RNA-guided endonuclease InsQ/TnpB family protein n=1 Tax=Streptomonospora litoralis TaxID=2498135 RepID=UPI003101234B